VYGVLTMKRAGGVDADGNFFLVLSFRTYSSWDMGQLRRLLNDEEQNATVVSYSDDQVEAIVYPRLPIPSQ
jgi:hypothetical protein